MNFSCISCIFFSFYKHVSKIQRYPSCWNWLAAADPLNSSWLFIEAQQAYKGKCRAQWKCTKQTWVRSTARTGSMALPLAVTPPSSEKVTNECISKAKVLPAFEFHFMNWKIRVHPFADDVFFLLNMLTSYVISSFTATCCSSLLTTTCIALT